MPTSFTAPLYEGEPDTFEDFALSCARGFMWFIHQRDENLGNKPRMRSVSDYTVRRVAETQEELRKWNAMSEDERYDAWRDYADKVDVDNRKSYATWEARNARYVKRLEEVEAWDCPDRLLPLKKYMREQLEGDMHKPYVSQIIEFDEWAQDRTSFKARSLMRAKDDYDNEVKMVAEQNETTMLLYTSLGLAYAG